MDARPAATTAPGQSPISTSQATEQSPLILVVPLRLRQQAEARPVGSYSAKTGRERDRLRRRRLAELGDQAARFFEVHALALQGIELTLRFGHDLWWRLLDEL